ncbi:MAG: hypothetical protein IJU72_07705 [Bacteroidales bacterium]|nr:hypothetical protein [Bacteroidales bacterium]
MNVHILSKFKTILTLTPLALAWLPTNAQHIGKLETQLHRMHTSSDTISAPQQTTPQAQLPKPADTLTAGINATAHYHASSGTLRIGLADSLPRIDTVQVSVAGGELMTFAAPNPAKSIPCKSSSSDDNEEWEEWEMDDDNWDWSWHWNRNHKTDKRFSAYAFKAMEWGINGLADGYSPVLTGELEWLDLRQARSWCFSINPIQWGLGLGSQHVGLVTGLGMMFNNYHLSGHLVPSVMGGITVPDSSFSSYRIHKNKMHTFGLNIPLLLEFNIPVRNNTLFFAVGAIGEARLFTRTKVVYDLDGDKKKEKTRNNNDLNMATLKYSLTARVGTEDIYLFCNYSPMPLFEPGKGPKVNAFSVGLGLIW